MLDVFRVTAESKKWGKKSRKDQIAAVSLAQLRHKKIDSPKVW